MDEDFDVAEERCWLLNLGLAQALLAASHPFFILNDDEWLFFNAFKLLWIKRNVQDEGSVQQVPIVICFALSSRRVGWCGI